MNGLAGMEKFSHLEDKIYLTIEFAKKMREEKEKFEREMKSLRQQNLVEAMSVVKAPSGSQPVEGEKKSDAKPTAPEKP